MRTPRSKTALLGAVAVASLLAGCAEERPTRPGPRELRILNLTDDIVESSVLLEDSTAEDDYSIQEKTFLMPDSALEIVDATYDLWFTGWVASACDDALVEIYYAPRGDWAGIYYRPGTSPCPAVSVSFSLTLMADECTPAVKYLEKSRVLRIRGACGFEVAFVRMSTDYEEIRLSPDQQITGMAHDGSLLWVAARPDAAFRENSLLLIDHTGSIIGKSPVDTFYVRGMTSDGSSTWILYGVPKLAFGLLHEDGSVTKMFDCPWISDELRSGIAWAEDRLWVLSWQWQGPSYKVSLAGINTSASIDSGSAVVDTIIPLPDRQPYGPNLAWDGEYLLTGRIRLSLDGHSGPSLPELPVRPTGHVACDGETLWMAHQGPIEFPGRPIRISRFRLPE